MTRAELFAETFRADQGDVLHIYDDGFILMVACSADRHLEIRALLKEHYHAFEEARSHDGFQSAFVIPADLSDTDVLGTPSQLSDKHFVPCSCSPHFNDHRLSDLWRLEDAEELAGRMQGMKK